MNSKSMTLKKYIEIKNTQYCYLKIIPHKSIRNYNSSNIAKTISHMYTDITKRITKIENKYIIQSDVKCSYFIDINKGNVSFYFIVPIQYKSLAVEKIKETWSKATIEEVEGINPFTPLASKYQLTYTKEDALSLSIDKASNEPLNSILNVMDIMEEGDRVAIMYNFRHYNEYIWKNEYNKTMNKIKRKEVIDREVNATYFFKMLLSTVNSLLEIVLEVIGDLFGNPNKKQDDIGFLEAVTDLITVNKNSLSNSTKKKKDSLILNTQIVVVSESADKIRESNNGIAVCQSFKSIEDDNTLVYKKVKTDLNLENFKIKNVGNNKVSVEECQNFLQIPGKTLLDTFRIKCNDTLEIDFPDELQEGNDGYICLGDNTFKGIQRKAYMSGDKNLANLGLTILGPQGAGKSEFIANYCNDVITNNEGVILIDFIKNCELSDKIKAITPAEKLIEINLNIYEQAQSFGFNEINNIECHNNTDILEIANMQTQLLVSFINAINPDSELSSRMRRSVVAAANVVFIHKNTSLRDVVQVCQDHRTRHIYISKIPDDLKNDLQDDVYNLEDMDEIDKKTGTVCGTKDSKVDFIIDRINLLMEDIKLKRMFNKAIDHNIDFLKAMNEGKVILIKIPESKFPTKFHKNILTTFFISKIWLASQLRGSLEEKPLRTHVIVDEIFQAPTSEKLLVDILPQGRKFQCKFIFSAHYLSQIDVIKEALKASGSSYMLLQGTDEKNFKEMENDLAPFELEDLLNLKRYHSLNMIKYSKGYAKFITKLPYILS